MQTNTNFPPLPRGLKGRANELATLSRTIESTAPTRLALVGAGGSGKSMLACALGHQLSPRFGGRIHWFRVGSWDFHTLTEMLALSFGTSRARGKIVPELRAFLGGATPARPRGAPLRDRGAGEERLIVLDNHEDDSSMARLLEALADTPATFVITARRCLLAGVLVFPITAPLVTSGEAAFPRVARLTRPLRWNPLALDIADAIVRSGEATTKELAEYLDTKGVGRVKVIDHEDDLPEVSLLVDWAWGRLGAASQRMLAVLSHIEGDHVDVESLAKLSHARARGRPSDALAPLQRWHLVQEPMRSRFAVHAVVRYAVAKRTTFAPDAVFNHYVSLLEQHPDRLMMEQTHLFSAMDYAQRAGDISAMMRIDALLRLLEPTRD